MNATQSPPSTPKKSASKARKANGARSSAGEDAKRTAKDAARDAKSAVEDAAEDAKSTVGDAARDAKSTVKDAAEDAKSTVKDAASTVKDAATQGAAKVEEALKKVPGKVEALAASGKRNLRGYVASAKELLGAAQDKVEAGRKKLGELAEHRAVSGAVAWWKERDTRPADHPDDVRATIDRLSVLARAFDGVRIPVAGKEIALGADLVLNFVRGGQWISMGAHGYLLFEAIRFGAPWSLIQTMVSRMTVDGALSAVPVVGAVYDATRLAHSKNARDLSAWLSEQLVAAGEEPHRPPELAPAAA